MEKTEAIIVTDSIPYKLLLSCSSGLSPAQVFVDFDESYDRVRHPDIDLENSISQIWDQKVQENTSFFNGKKFRYGGHALHRGQGSTQGHCVCLHLGLTDYRTFMGTNLNALWENFLTPSEDDSIRCQHTSNPLGNGAIVETSDGKIVVLQRSNKVGEFPGYFVFPGGHPEPQEIGISSNENGRVLTDSKDINRMGSQEMFDSIIREVVEEIGVPSSSLCSPVFIGISLRKLNVRPAAFFYIKCNLQSDKVQELYNSAQDGYESTQIYTISLNEVETMTSKMPGCHQGGFALYKLMINALEKNTGESSVLQIN